MTTIENPPTASQTYRALDVLRTQLQGDLITPGAPEYDQARQIVSIVFDRHPAAIVRPASSEDVARAVRFAREWGMEIAVRSGGHSVAGHSVVDGALVIDVGAMREVQIDPVASTAVVQAGVTSEELAGQAAAYGLALSTGDTGSVGIGGLTVGGGIGWMARSQGLAIDNLLSATVVTAAGEVIEASAASHADLFWAIRGGGGNFGIVTEFTFRLAPHGMVQGGVIALPATADVLRGYLDYAHSATEDLTTIAFMLHAPPAPFIPAEAVGQPALIVGVCYTGPEDGLEAALAPIRALADPIADTVATIPYPVMFAYTAEGTKRHGSAVRTLFANELDDAQIDAMIDAMRAASSPFDMIQIRGMGGAIGRVPADGTAFAHRGARLMIAILALWYDPEDDGATHRAWAADLFAALAPAATGAYVNFLQDDGNARMYEAYPQVTMQRLRLVKTTYDPENVFHHNQNIIPAVR